MHLSWIIGTARHQLVRAAPRLIRTTRALTGHTYRWTVAASLLAYLTMWLLRQPLEIRREIAQSLHRAPSSQLTRAYLLPNLAQTSPNRLLNLARSRLR